jgi:translation initiation factor IF-2
MTATTVSQFAVELKMPASALLEQLGKAGVGKQTSNDLLTDQDKAKLLDYLRRAHGDESKAKITLTRKETSEIKATDSHGRARTVQVEVRKKRVLVKREVGDHQQEAVTADVEEAPLNVPVIELAPEPEPIPEPVD